ncbi:unnamed protein product [Thelazia callipaeda]|uniref:Uncharacterized protein n=1 Tax=Thelazia callipaeda TaxID=103827 RepID=A0A0N5D0F8_THECL|nr:unnamed protein product [Thelazia callipaeda]
MLKKAKKSRRNTAFSSMNLTVRAVHSEGSPSPVEIHPYSSRDNDVGSLSHGRSTPDGLLFTTPTSVNINGDDDDEEEGDDFL